MATKPKNKGKPEKRSGIAFERPVPEFVPAACMYDANTVLTKNGELLHTIKIVGFTKESVGSETLDLRNLIRKAIRESIKDNRFAVWVHTVRKFCNLDPGGKFDDSFCADLNRTWKEANDWEHQYVNEVYVSVLIEGKNALISDVQAFIKSMYFSSFYKVHEKYLADRIGELYQVTDAMLEVLSNFGAKRMGLYKRNGVYYSEYMRFFGSLMNLRDQEYPVDLQDMAVQIADHKLAFGYNMFQVNGPEGNKFGAMFSVKEYHEMPLDGIDVVVQLPMQMIVTQTINFVDTKRAMEEYEDQYQILKFSGAKKLLEMSGLKDIMEDEEETSLSFGEGQLTIMLIDPDMEGLEKNIELAREAFEELGMVAPRLDVGLEDGFWSQLPGNFNFVRYRKTINLSGFAGMASLFNFPAGKRYDNRWGEALTMFKTAGGTPFFFSFHVGEAGHTAVMGPDGMGKTVLMNFLLSESNKFNPRILLLDMDGQSRLFVEMINGSYRILRSAELPPEEKPAEEEKPLEEAPAAAAPAPGTKAAAQAAAKAAAEAAKAAAEGKIDTTPDPAPTCFLYDPFASGDRDVHFLTDWLEAFIMYDPEDFGVVVEKKHYGSASFSGGEQEEEDDVILEVDREELTHAVKSTLELPLFERSLGKAASCLRKSYKRKFVNFTEGGEYQSLFAANVDPAMLQNRVTAFEMGALYEHPQCIQPALLLLLRDLLASLDGSPAILVLDEAWHLLNTRFIMARLDGLLDDLQERNCVAVFATENIRNASKRLISDKIVSRISTRIFLPNLRAEEYSLSYRKVWKLTDDQYDTLAGMQVSEREFMLIQNEEAVVCRLNLRDIPHLAALRTMPYSLLLAQRLKQELGERPEKWYPAFLRDMFATRTRKL